MCVLSHWHLHMLRDLFLYIRTTNIQHACESVLYTRYTNVQTVAHPKKTWSTIVVALSLLLFVINEDSSALST